MSFRRHLQNMFLFSAFWAYMVTSHEIQFRISAGNCDTCEFSQKCNSRRTAKGPSLQAVRAETMVDGLPRACRYVREPYETLIYIIGRNGKGGDSKPIFKSLCKKILNLFKFFNIYFGRLFFSFYDLFWSLFLSFDRQLSFNAAI